MRSAAALQSLFQLRLVHPGTALHGALRRLVAKLSQRAATRTWMRSQTAALACRHVVDRRDARLLGLAMLCPLLRQMLGNACELGRCRVSIRASVTASSATPT